MPTYFPPAGGTLARASHLPPAGLPHAGHSVKRVVLKIVAGPREQDQAPLYPECDEQPKAIYLKQEQHMHNEKFAEGSQPPLPVEAVLRGHDDHFQYMLMEFLPDGKLLSFLHNPGPSLPPLGSSTQQKSCGQKNFQKII